MDAQLKELKNLFEAKKKTIKKANDAGFALDRKIDEIFGFNYSETDNDELIDTLDYGTSSITFKYFLELMNYYKDEKKFGSNED